jgi:hypothetical protein
MSKIEKTIQRQQQKIEEGQFYEAHQQLRVIASRYVKQGNNDAATDILSSGAQLLLKAGQGGSRRPVLVPSGRAHQGGDQARRCDEGKAPLPAAELPTRRTNEEEIRVRNDWMVV